MSVFDNAAARLKPYLEDIATRLESGKVNDEKIAADMISDLEKALRGQ